MSSLLPLANKLSGQKVLITGARGFLGSHLCRRLITLDAEVYGVSRAAWEDRTTNVRWCQGDFADIDSARSLVQTIKPHLIVHLAGVVAALPDMELVLPTMHSLLVSNVNALVVAMENRCRRVLLAGSLTEPESDEGHSVPASPYAAAKWASSAYARMFYQLYKAPVVTVRPFMTYGPRQDARKLIPHVISSLLRGESPKVSSGDWLADWVYVDDVIDGFIAAAQSPDVEGLSFDFGSGAMVSSRTIVEEIVRLIGNDVRPAYGARPDRPSEPVRKANMTQTRSKLGWEAKISLTDGLRRTIESYKNSI